MEDKRNVPYVLYESQQARNERTVKRLVIALIIVTLLMFVTNILWLHTLKQYNHESGDAIIVDSNSGPANYIGDDGDIYNGQTDDIR